MQRYMASSDAFHNCRQIARMGDGIGDANWPVRTGLRGLVIAGLTAAFLLSMIIDNK
jgi:hypothetical protein